MLSVSQEVVVFFGHHIKKVQSYFGSISLFMSCGDKAFCYAVDHLWIKEVCCVTGFHIGPVQWKI